MTIWNWFVQQAHCSKLPVARSLAATVTSLALASGFILTTQSTSLAQAAYGSYVGVGVSTGLTQGGGAYEGRQLAATITGRYKMLEFPVSLRGQALVFSGTTAIIPVVSYDVPLNWQTDAYIGAGYSFSSGDSPSPVGNKNAFVIQPGIDYSVPESNLVIFGNAIFAFDAYRSGGTAASLQGGVGLRF
ncbi:MAG: hypothetical protein VKJ46_10305 [Leptolyngbyaceae bacterium]|nr:hypothetical protein [Leptolyngbyaceae bacterium]